MKRARKNRLNRWSRIVLFADAKATIGADIAKNISPNCINSNVLSDRMIMNKLFSGINKKIFFFILVSLVIQVALAVFFWNNEIPPSDAASYVELAEDCVKENVWYPAAKHLYSSYLFAPGWSTCW